MARIGFIGLGNMGLPMAINLIKAGHAVTGFVKKHRQDVRRATSGGMLHEPMHNADFRNRIKRPPGVPTQSFGVCNRCEENDGVPAELNVVLQCLFLFGRQFRISRIKRNRLVLMQRNGKVSRNRHRLLRIQVRTFQAAPGVLLIKETSHQPTATTGCASPRYGRNPAAESLTVSLKYELSPLNCNSRPVSFNSDR